MITTTKPIKVGVRRTTKPNAIIQAIEKGPSSLVKARVQQVIHENLRNARPEPGENRFGKRNPGPTFMKLVKDALKQPVKMKDGRVSNRYKQGAEEFAKQVANGNIHFIRELVSHEETKEQSEQTTVVVKQYIGIPVDDQPGAP